MQSKNIKNTTKKKRKKIEIDEFSKWIVLLSYILLCFWVTGSYILLVFDKGSNPEVTVALITNTLTSTIGYFISNALAKNSRNKYRIDANGNPFAPALTQEQEIDNFMNNFNVNNNNIDNVRTPEDGR